jgi:tripartite ATP-independent transporter DctM subunit
MVWVILATGLVLTAWTGAPIGIGLGLTGLAILHFVAGGGEQLAVTAVWNVFTDFTLSAVPLFLLMGEILMASGVSNRLYTAVAPIFHRVPGKLLHTNIAVCTLFGAVSGASMSTAAAVGSVAYPELRRRGYHPPTVVGTLAAGGTLGLLIPPSLSLLIYGATMEVSIGRLFLAGIFPGLMLASFFMLVILLTNLLRTGLTPVDTERPAVLDQLLGLLGIWPLGFLVFAVLGTIYLGWATPTEAAGLGVVASVIVGATWGDLTLVRLGRAVVSATFTFGSIGFVVLGALILAQAISILALPLQLMSGIADLAVSRYVVLGLVVAFYLILGCFFDGISLLLMTIPLVFPVMTGLGFDAVWLGVIITILIEIGMLTPPVGINLFVLVAITENEVSLAEAAKATIPYWIFLLGGVVILTVFPEIALYLPSLMD